METIVSNENAKTVEVMKGQNPRNLYAHQLDAINELNSNDEKENMSALVVLPTGAGKTMTAVRWLLSTAINKNKKVLWIAHRHLLLEQAADAFAINAYSDIILNRQTFKYRIISGNHDRPIHIKPDDDILVMSKDSLAPSPNALDSWLAGEEELYFVIDEAHHTTAKSYGKIINYLKAKDLRLKLLGLTATPFRTSEQEQGLLGKIFTDGIVYQTDLRNLIKKGILATPHFEEYHTESLLGENLEPRAIKRISQSDIIPEALQKQIVDNAMRNKFIVNQFFKNGNPKRYGKTLVFALNKIHAYSLKKLFEEEAKKQGMKLGIGVIVSGKSSEFIGIDISNKDNQEQIEAFGLPSDDPKSIQILINVNILTEGADLPRTQTVFLTRPTTSTVLMTQMIGRALRGENAGGTNKAIIVSFIDQWRDKIAWVNPEIVISTEENEFSESESQREKSEIHLISVAKIEEFAKIADDAVDTTYLEGIDFSERIPLGMYMFSYMDTDGSGNYVEHNHQILVYNNSKIYYENLIGSLPDLFAEYQIREETIDMEKLDEMIQHCEIIYFEKNMFPPYDWRDIEALLKFYAQKELEPLFVPFKEENRQKVNLERIAKDIIANDMPPSKEKIYIEDLWEDENTLLKAYYRDKLYFIKQLDTEKHKLQGLQPIFSGKPDNTTDEMVNLSRFNLYDVCEKNPEIGNALKEIVYSKARVTENSYACMICRKISSNKGFFEIDHIRPLSKGGLTEENNLQLLCRACNRKKSNQYEE